MIDKKLRLAIYEAIKAKGDFLGSYSADQGIMSFLSNIWPLRAMESRDARFKNAYDDAFQHVVNNNDWDEDEIYLKRFELIDGPEEYFNKFVETVVAPITRESIGSIQDYVVTINKILVGNREALIVIDYYNELPIYNIGERGKDKKRSLVLRPNTIPFFKTGIEITQYPCFVLAKDDWDYPSFTSFILKYFSAAENWERVGTVKIMKARSGVVWEALENKFFVLSHEFCSLGQEKSYYTKLKSLFPETYQSILMALRDTAFFPKVYELFENDETFKKSLIRENVAEKLQRTVRAELLDIKLQGYKFNYVFRPPYSDDGDDGLINLFFDFKTQAEFPQRIVAMIGKNGVGKTRILNSLIINLRSRESNNIVPNNLVFSKYFTVSYSVFDRFLAPEPDTAFNYVYCGLKNGPNSIKSQSEQITEFYEAARQIKERDLGYQWYQIVSAFLSADHINKMFPNHEEEAQSAMVTFSENNFKEIEDQFSSGESIVLFVMTKIVSEIREESLILYDEPETHLHPNAITSLMNALSKLLDRFNSFCIIATHSPLIIRELNPGNVIVLRRVEKSLEASNLSIDSFGQNLTVIVEEIFGNKDVSKLYLEKIRTLVQANNSFDEIIRTLQVGQIPVNLNMRLLINSLINNRG